MTISTSSEEQLDQIQLNLAQSIPRKGNLGCENYGAHFISRKYIYMISHDLYILKQALTGYKQNLNNFNNI